MIKLLIIFLFFFIYGCSVDNKANIFSKKKNLKNLNKDEKLLFIEENTLNKEFNSNIKIYLKDLYDNDSFINNKTNNHKIQNINGNLNEISKFKFSKFKSSKNFNSELLITKKSGIFLFDGKGTIFRLNKNLKVIWKKNYYKKKEKKLNPSINFSHINDRLVITDDLSNIYSLNIDDGSLIWKKKNSSSFNSQIKIHKKKIYTIDYENILRCFSLSDGKEIWNFKGENSLIKKNKKSSLVLDENNVIFINEVGDVNAIDLSSGNLIWQTPTQSIAIYEDSFSYIYSNIVLDEQSIYFSNNKNEFFALNSKNGFVKWKQNLSTILPPIIINNIVFTISDNGYLAILDKKNGNILRSTHIKKELKIKENRGFIIGKKHIFLTFDPGQLIKINVNNGKPENIYKIHRGSISRPYVFDGHLYIVTDKSIKKFD